MTSPNLTITIELHHEQPSEEATFKGLAAIGGCGLLLLTLCFVVVAAVIDGLQVPIRDTRFWHSWPLVLLGVIGAFLLVQSLVRYVFSATKARRGSD